MKIICFDLDGVICTNTWGKYEDAKPIKKSIKKINELYEKGYNITVMDNLSTQIHGNSESFLYKRIKSTIKENYMDEKSPILESTVNKNESELKLWLVNYVGDKTNPENGDVTVENIIDVMAEEFPEFLMALAEENWIRGYHQALTDVEVGEKLAKEQSELNKVDATINQ